MKRVTLTLLFALLSLPALAAEPRKLQIALPDGYETSADVLEVSWKRFHVGSAPLKFGEFSVVDHHRGILKNRSRSSSVIPPWLGNGDVQANSSKSSQHITFKLNAADAPAWDCDCELQGESESTEVRGVPVSGEGVHEWTCILSSLTEPTDIWSVRLTQQATLRHPLPKITGELRNSAESFEIKPIQTTATGAKAFGPLGYAVVGDDMSLLAAIEMMNRDTVLIPKAADRELRSVLAATAATVMLTQ